MVRYWAACAIFVVGTAFAGDQYYVQVPAQYESDASTRQGIRDECGLESLLGNYVLQSVGERFAGTLPKPDGAVSADAKVLNLTILRAYGHGGGGWSGSKSITLRADLVQNGQVVRFLIKREHSRGGMLGGVSGTCYIFEKVAQAMGKHVVRWLQAPTAVRSDAVESREEEKAPLPEETKS